MYELNSIALCASYSMIFADDVNKYPANNLWSAICFKIMTRYTRGFFPRIVAIIPATRYTCVFLSRILAFFPALWAQTRIYMRTKKPYICVTNKHVVHGVTESRRIRGTELYRQQKTSSCTMELKSNFSLNQAWPQWSR